MSKKSKIVEGVKWEDLQIDCLVNILGRVGIESLIVDVPFVCKSWYKATLNPLCWKELQFPRLDKCPWPPHVDPFREGLGLKPFIDRFREQLGLNPFKGVISLCEFEFVKGIIDRSAGSATTVDLRMFFYRLDEEFVNYVADKCSALKNLKFLGSNGYLLRKNWPLIFRKLKNLESLEIVGDYSCEKVVKEIGSNCENFVSLKLVGLRLYGQCNKRNEREVTAIVTDLPKLRFLAMKDVFIDREKLIKIIKGCVNLICLDVRDCCGFDEHDEELAKLASHIPTFLCTGSYIVTADGEDSLSDFTSSDIEDSDSDSVSDFDSDTSPESEDSD